MLSPADVIDGRYVIADLLGRGGMADVFRATDTLTGRPVAVKALRGVDAADVRRFRSEAEVMARLDHPGLVRLHRSGTHDGIAYLVLDLADGPPLTSELAAGPLPLDRALTVGEQVAAALAHAHRAGVVHRDVKPANILLDGPGRVVLADFGIARLPGATGITHTGQVVGSAPYLAPEQVTGEPAGPPADAYALGLVMIECLTGRRCYAGSRAEAAVVRLHRQPDIPADVPHWLHDVLVAATARDPGRRPSAGAMAEAFSLRSADPVVATTAAFRAPAALGRGRRDPRAARRRLVPALAAAILALVGLAPVLRTGGDDGSPGSRSAATAVTAASPPSSVSAVAAAPAPAGSGAGRASTASPGPAAPSAPAPPSPGRSGPPAPTDTPATTAAPGDGSGIAGPAAADSDRGDGGSGSNRGRGNGDR